VKLHLRSQLPLLVLLLSFSSLQAADIRIDTRQPAKKVSPSLFGIFVEEINHGGDGGIYSELVRNGSFGRPELRHQPGLEWRGVQLRRLGCSRSGRPRLLLRTGLQDNAADLYKTTLDPGGLLLRGQVSAPAVIIEKAGSPAAHQHVEHRHPTRSSA
jgi:hypothetical protein